MNRLLKQIKDRRIALNLKQHDMMMRVGMSRQQYQRLESKGNPRLDTLELVAKGLRSELLLIPQEKISEVLTILDDHGQASSELSNNPNHHVGEKNVPLDDDPWRGLLGDNE